MFSSALKSISSTNINSNYSISQTITSTAGPWKIYDAKNKKSGKAVSVFVFDKKSLDAHGQSLSRSSAAAFKKVAEEVVERLKKEASSLAKLRHPSVLELVEPVEDTRGGGLQFATEPVTASLASLLQEKDEQERSGGRSSRYVTEDSDGNRRRRELEIDELEIQKGLLQISKALEFLHENAGLVHGNLTPDAILINAKSDWKISGLQFCSPPEHSDKPTSFQPISLSEVLHLDPRLPRTVQLNLDFTSPDFVLDNNLTTSADMFSLGLLCVALYNSPHRSPLECNTSISAYKRLFTSSSTVPSTSNGFLSSRPLPKDLANHVLPRLITRRPAQRMTAREFQQSEFFDNILISTIRFLDAFPAKTPNEKAQFLRGLIKVLPSFPKSVMEKKVLPALLDELKDRDLISLILHNVFKIIELLPSGKRAFGEKIRPSLKEIFVTNAKQNQEKDPARDAGLMIVLEQLSVIANNSSGKEFKDDILPIIINALDSPTPSLVDAALRALPVMLPILDFSTIKNELFPVIATVFSKTNSLAIKVRGLQAFVTLCGGSSDPSSDDGLDGLAEEKKKGTSSTALDKYTMQEKIIPLVKAIKTREPAVMIAALNVLRVIGQIADAEFVAMEILPILWSMSLGPLLNLKQFQSFMGLIKTLSARVEEEQARKLTELGGSNGVGGAPTNDFMSFDALAGTHFDANGTTEDDFETLVKGKAASASTNPMDAGWDTLSTTSAVASPGIRPPKSTSPAPAFSWSTPSPTSMAPPPSQFGAVKAQQSTFRTVTPDLGGFQSLTPSSTQFSQPLQPSGSGAAAPPLQPAAAANWGAAVTSNPWGSSSAATPSFPAATPATLPLANKPMGSGLSSPMSSMSIGGQRPDMGHQRVSSFSLAPPPSAPASGGASGFSLAPPPAPSGGVQNPWSSGSSNSFGMGNLGSGSSMNSLGSLGGGSAAAQGLGANRLSMGGGGGSSMNSMSNMGSMGSMMGGGGSLNSMGMAQRQQQQQQQQQQQFQPQPQQAQRSGLDKYESLL